ncbi:hypothetical protein [Pseudoprimorskyibacter insulae]|uniref:Uncharacterized protein n=1 Tax=Pseudoprimorskyibacter insulae TaxID=1695997 RepID=A0A2R8AWK1_9RHOB|nr:hypothetical protein [Pseudoprimorskyibacter insulae]SPF80368.1 hypothetical protein PRI8871_02173 [Pseudoprimorskyibacter insulae]
MQTIENGYRGFRVLVDIYSDRVLSLAVLTGGLWMGAYLLTL